MMKAALFVVPFFVGSSALAAIAEARHCGEANCGPGGVCREQSLIARCECDSGWISVTTYLGGGSQGAFCVRIPAAPDDDLCQEMACGPNGTCLGEAAGTCLCDPGYRQERNTCVDDPQDDAEAPCRDVRCGEGATCMVTPDGATCRCAGAEFVVLGLDARGELGPVCQAPADPESACGPEACGPAGRCVISQAAFCRCDAGFHVEDREAPGGRDRPYCVDADGQIPPGEGGESEGTGEGPPGEGGSGSETGPSEGGEGESGGSDRADQEGCAQSAGASPSSWWRRR
jgi:hypothetical protein